MRFFKLFTEVGVGLGTILNGYCGTTTASHGTSVKSVCDKWNNAVDTFLYNIEPEVIVTKAGSAVGWGVTKAGDWQSGIASLYTDWSPDLGFIYSILDTGGTFGGGLPPGEVSALSDVYTGPKEIMLAPCIICKVIPDAPTTTPSAAAITPAADEFDFEPAPSASSEEVQGFIKLCAGAIIFIMTHVWIMLNAARRNVFDTHVIPFLADCTDGFCAYAREARRVYGIIVTSVSRFIDIVSAFGQPISLNGNEKFLVTRKDGKLMSLITLTSNKVVLVMPLTFDEGEEEVQEAQEVNVEEPQPAEREPPAPVWNPDMHISTSGPRQSRRGMKKAAKAKKSKGKKGGA